MGRVLSEKNTGKALYPAATSYFPPWFFMKLLSSFNLISSGRTVEVET
jgi:hypothetical protein